MTTISKTSLRTLLGAAAIALSFTGSAWAADPPTEQSHTEPGRKEERR